VRDDFDQAIDPPAAVLFLPGQCRCLRNGTDIEAGEIAIQKKMKQRLPPSVLHLLGDGGEVGMVLHMQIAHIQDEVPASVGAGRNNPITVGRHDQVDAVAHRKWVKPFRLD